MNVKRWITLGFCTVGMFLSCTFGGAGIALAAGIPPVSVKIAEYPTTLTFAAPAGASWQAGDKHGDLPAGKTCVIRGVMVKPAVKKFHVMVESVAMREPEKVEAALAKWRSTGRTIHTFRLGRISYASDGKTPLYDGRVEMIGVGLFDEQPPAQQLVDTLAGLGSSSWILEEVLSRSQGRLELQIGKKTVAKTDGPLQIIPKETLNMQKVEAARGYSWHGFHDRVYRGALTVQWGAQNALDCLLATDLETVLAGVVPSEISSKAALGALQAQAVAARGEILGKMGMRHLGEGFDFCSEQHCQVFSGESEESIRIGKAIAPTRGFLLQDPDGGIVDAVYAANCGGHGESNHLVWTSPPDPILAGVWDLVNPPDLDLTREKDVATFIRTPPLCYCADTSVEGGDKFRWKKSLTGTDWQGVVERAGVGRIRDIGEFARGVSGRLYRLTIVGEKGPRSIMKELPIRKLFGGLRSACFVVTFTKDASGFISGAEFEGAGWGHGVGMCQTGAQSLARLGQPFSRILMHYFPGSKLVKTY